MDSEIQIIKDEIIDKRIESFQGIKFIIGRLRGRNIVLAKTGVGKVNAAMTTMLLIDHFTPEEVIFTGVAGAVNPELEPGDVVIGEKVAQHDLVVIRSNEIQKSSVCNPRDGSENPIFFPADSILLCLADEAQGDLQFESVASGDRERIPRVLRGVVVSGDAFVSSHLKRQELRISFGADAVEMEGAAVAQVCYQQATPCLIIRGICDHADEDASRDLTIFSKIASVNSADLVIEIVQKLAERHEKRRLE
jgi:adenosylhomocysteine nucleosidase